MIELKAAYEKAHKEFPEYKMIECLDIGDAYAFYFSQSETENIPGLPYVSVNKESGSVGYLTIPPFENLEIIRKGKKIEITE